MPGPTNRFTDLDAMLTFVDRVINANKPKPKIENTAQQNVDDKSQVYSQDSLPKSERADTNFHRSKKKF